MECLKVFESSLLRANSTETLIEIKILDMASYLTQQAEVHTETASLSVVPMKGIS